MPIKNVLFDAYGTLLSTGNGSVAAAKKILHRNQRSDIPEEAFYKRWKAYHKLHIRQAVPFVREETIFYKDLCRLYQEYGIAGDAAADVELMLATLGRRVAFPEAGEVLHTLGASVTTGIASVTDTAPLLQDLRRNELQVKWIFTSEQLQAYKPDPIFYQKILQQLGADAKDVLFVGDSPEEDILGPRRAGMKTCWINRKDLPALSIQPDFVIRNLTELYRILD